MYSMCLLDSNVVVGTVLVSLLSSFSFSRYIRLTSSNDKQKLEELLFPVKSSVFLTFQRMCAPESVLNVFHLFLDVFQSLGSGYGSLV